MNGYELIFTNGEKINAGTMFCVGQNYAKHAAEMGSKVSDNPIIFLKPPQALIIDGGTVNLPDFSENVHYEVELVVVIGKDCQNVRPEEASSYIAGYAVGVDITARDIQAQAKQSGKPWALAKGFRNSAPISNIVPASEIPANSYFDLKLSINNELKQSGNTQEMERSVTQLISYLSEVFFLKAGDIIFTGTPEGVGKIKSGDRITAELGTFISLNFNVK